MRKLLDLVIRLAVGGLFIFSGLIKLNDPIGTKIKLQEYFEVFSTDFGTFFQYFIPYALLIGMVLIVLEVVLGIAVLINFKMEKTTWFLMVLIVFFSFLTFYSAYFNKVTDCGCFGDAIKLTPWESFIKDVILFVLILHLFWYRHSYEAVFLKRPSALLILGSTLLSTYLGIHAINHLPFKDFRAYKVGNILPDLTMPEEEPITEYTFEKDGATVVSEKYLSEKDGYTYVASRIVNEDKIQPLLVDYFVMDSQGNDSTTFTFKGTKMVLVFQNTESDTSEEITAINGLIESLGNQVEPIILTSVSEQQIDALRHEYQLAMPYFFADATVLKAMIRSSPGLLLLKNGTVLGKWHYNDVPSKADVLKLILDAQ